MMKNIKQYVVAAVIAGNLLNISYGSNPSYPNSVLPQSSVLTLGKDIDLRNTANDRAKTLLAKINTVCALDAKSDLRLLLDTDQNLSKQEIVKTISNCVDKIKFNNPQSGNLPVVLLEVTDGKFICPYFFNELSIYDSWLNGKKITYKSGTFKDDEVQKILRQGNLNKDGVFIRDWNGLWQQEKLLFFVTHDKKIFILAPKQETNAELGAVTSEAWHTSSLKKAAMLTGGAAAAAAALIAVGAKAKPQKPDDITSPTNPSSPNIDQSPSDTITTTPTTPTPTNPPGTNGGQLPSDNDPTFTRADAINANYNLKDIKDKLIDIKDKSREKFKDIKNKSQEKFKDIKDKSKKKFRDIKNKSQEKFQDIKDKFQNKLNGTKGEPNADRPPLIPVSGYPGISPCPEGQCLDPNGECRPCPQNPQVPNPRLRCPECPRCPRCPRCPGCPWCPACPKCHHNENGNDDKDVAPKPPCESFIFEASDVAPNPVDSGAPSILNNVTPAANGKNGNKQNDKNAASDSNVPNVPFTFANPDVADATIPDAANTDATPLKSEENGRVLRESQGEPFDCQKCGSKECRIHRVCPNKLFIDHVGKIEREKKFIFNTNELTGSNFIDISVPGECSSLVTVRRATPQEIEKYDLSPYAMVHEAVPEPDEGIQVSIKTK
ncbi:MAG: hypothetical protein LBB11_00540 [Puniceicoccales bacterium]|nr:hypothetical protein [Puniceicoccales bacterium]